MGQIIKGRVLIKHGGQFSISKEELDNFSSIIQNNIYTILRNFKKASESQFHGQEKSFEAIQKALVPTKPETSPTLQPLTQAATNFLLAIFLPGGVNDITLPRISYFPYVSGFIFNMLKSQLASGVRKVLETGGVSNPASQTLGKKTVGESLNDLISDAIFPIKDALELKNLIGALPSTFTPLPGLFLLEGGLPAQNSLANVCGEVAGTLISGLYEDGHIQKAISDVQSSLKDMGICISIHLEVSSILEQTLSTLKAKTRLDGAEKFLLSSLGNKEAKGAITSYLEATILTIINNFLTDLSNDKVHIPEGLLNREELIEKRVDLLVKFILEATKIQSIPLPSLLEPVRPFLDQLLQSPLIKSTLHEQVKPLVQQLDVVLGAQQAEEGKKVELGLSTAIAPNVAKLGGVAAGAVVKTLLKQSPHQKPFAPEVKGAFTSILSSLKALLKPGLYSSSAPPPDMLKMLFKEVEKGYQLSPQGIFLASLLEKEATLDSISNYLTATFSEFVDHLKKIDPAHLQIPKELLDPTKRDAKQVSTWVLELFLEKGNLNLPPCLNNLQTGIYTILSKVAEQQTPSLFLKLDDFVKKEPVKEKGTNVLLKELQQPLTVLGAHIGLTFLQGSLKENDLKKEMTPLLERGFNPEALLLPKKLLTEFFDVVSDELERKDTSRPPLKMFKNLLFKEDPQGVFTPNDLGKVLVYFLKNETLKNKLASLVEANFLIVLEKLCSQQIKPEQLLESLCSAFDSLIPLLQGSSQQEEPSSDTLTVTLRPLMEDFLRNVQLELGPATQTAWLNAALSKLLTTGITTCVKKIEDNIPNLLEMVISPTTRFGELKQAMHAIATGLHAQKKESPLSQEKLSDYSERAYKFVKALFPEIRIPESICKAFIKHFIPYVEIPVVEALKTTLQAASDSKVSMRKLLEDIDATKPSQPVASLKPARKFLKAIFKALKEELNLQGLDEKESKNRIISWLKKKFKTILFIILGWIIPRLFRKTQEEGSMTQRIQALVKATKAIFTTKSP